MTRGAVMARNWEVDFILEALGKPARGGGLFARHLVSDSREVEPGDVFFGLDGERVRGADYIAKALSRGAVLALRGPGEGVDDERVIVVDDPRESLAKLAGRFREGIDVPVVGITGSVGKTTVKDFLGTTLREDRDTVVPRASFNNRLGVSLTLGRITPATQAVVVEMGTNAPGEIAGLCELARPTLGVLTAIEAAHLAGLGDLDGVRAEKLALPHALPDGAALFVNVESEALRSYEDERLDVRRLALRVDEGVSSPRESAGRMAFRDGYAEVEHPFSFRAQRLNLWVALNVARELGVPAEAMQEAAKKLNAPPLRGELRRIGDCLLVLDCYNANPTSTAAALLELATLPCPRRAVLGEMLELGERREAEHRRLGVLAARAGLDQVVFVGPSAAAFRDGVESEGADELDLRLFADTEAARDWVQAQLRHPGTLLFKGSRGMALESLLEPRT